MRKQATDSKKIFVKYTSNRELLLKMYKEFLKHNSKQTTGFKNWKGLDRHLIKEDIQIANKHMKVYSASYVIGEMQIKMRYQCTLIQMAKVWNTDTKCWQGRGATETHSLLLGTQNGTATVEVFGGFFQNQTSSCHTIPQSCLV